LTSRKSGCKVLIYVWLTIRNFNKEVPAVKKIINRLLSQARRRLMAKPVTAYALEQHHALLKPVFALLAEESERGEAYRHAVSDWPWSRRPVRASWEGTSYTLEVDDPAVDLDPPIPIGGRIFSRSGPTWVELPPRAAYDIERRVREATEAVLDDWLTSMSLKNKILDPVSVKIKSPYRDIKEVVPDEVFWRHEATLVFATYSGEGITGRAAPITDYPLMTYYFEGFHGAPSKCLVVAYQDGGHVHVALSHYYSLFRTAGTSPTNLFAELATQIRVERYRDRDPSSIDFYDHWPVGPLTLNGREELLHVRMIWDKARERYTSPEWHRADGFPPLLLDLIRDAVAGADAWRQQHIIK
jgi:hypothetical protein